MITRYLNSVVSSFLLPVISVRVEKVLKTSFMLICSIFLRSFGLSSVHEAQNEPVKVYHIVIWRVGPERVLVC